MAKKGNRIIFLLECEICKARNYSTTKNRINTKEKVGLKKYCNNCKKKTNHKEVKATH